MNLRSFSIKDRLASFKYAGAGMVQLLATQHNALIHLAATIIAIGMGWYLKLSATEWLFISVAIALVWITELFNTAIETICNRFCPTPDPHIKLIKDLAAAAVLVAAILACTIAIIIYIPKIL